MTNKKTPVDWIVNRLRPNAKRYHPHVIDLAKEMEQQMIDNAYCAVLHARMSKSLDESLKLMTPQEKARQLVDSFGKHLAPKVVEEMMDMYSTTLSAMGAVIHVSKSAQGTYLQQVKEHISKTNS